MLQEVDDIGHAPAIPHPQQAHVLFHHWHHPQLCTAPSPPSSPSRWGKPFAWRAVSVWPIRCSRMTHTYLLSRPPLSVYRSLSLSLPPPLCLPLKANLVAAFEQSLALMTARLETLSVCSDQKVLVPTAVKPTETFVTVYIYWRKKENCVRTFFTNTRNLWSNNHSTALY